MISVYYEYSDFLKDIVPFALSVATKTEVNPRKPVLSKIPDVQPCPPLLFGLVSCAHC